MKYKISQERDYVMVFIIVHFYHKSATCINKMLEGSPLICDENVFHHLLNNCIVHQLQSNITSQPAMDQQ